MAGTAGFVRRIPRRTRKTVTFDGGSGSGAVGTVAVGTVTGSVLITHMAVRCKTLLAGATATVELGSANNTAALIAQTTATDIDADEFWRDATPEAEISPAIADAAVGADLIITVGTAAVSAGVLEIVYFWIPMSDDGNLA